MKHTKACIAIVLINILVFVLWHGSHAFELASGKQILIYGFMHGNFLHLIINSVMLVLFGISLERKWGAMMFLCFYVWCILAGGLAQLIIDPSTHIVGSSAATFGMLIAYGIEFPKRVVYLFFIKMTAKRMVILYVGIEIILALTGLTPTIAHWAHLGGAVMAGLMTPLYRQIRQ